jgi:hypothetical protein
MSPYRSASVGSENRYSGVDSSLLVASAGDSCLPPGTDGYCSPRHQTHVPSFLEFNGIV